MNNNAEFDNYISNPDVPDKMATLDIQTIPKPKLINNFASLTPSDDFCEITKAKQSERNSIPQ